MAKIAVELERALKDRRNAGGEGRATSRLLASGQGWSVSDVICTSGPDDRPFEERHAGVSIAIVAAGTFQYRASAHPVLMAPGSFLLGNPGQGYECGHEHGAGDRCLSFKYAPEAFENAIGSTPSFGAVRLPPLRAAAPLVARAFAALSGATDVSWEELSVEVAARAAQLANGIECGAGSTPPHAVSRVTRAIRAMERHPDAALPLHGLAHDAGLSPYHFLRMFRRIAGVTPHQFALRSRLREAALRLVQDNARVIDVALDSGFGDLSNFNRSFRAEFGIAPRAYRRRGARR